MKSISISINDLSRLDSILEDDYDQINIISSDDIIHHYNINNHDEFLIISDNSSFLESLSRDDLEDNLSIKDMILDSLDYLINPLI